MDYTNSVCRRLVAGLAPVVLLAVIAAVPALAAEDDEAINKVRANLQTLLPGTAPDSIAPTAVPGLYEVTLGPEIVYTTADGRYLIQGNIIDLEERRDITAPRQRAAKAAAVNAVGEDQMVIFGPKDAAHTITVFTDIDCGFCRKLHSEMDSYNKAGIRVRYLFFPRAGLNSDSYRKAVAVWCAEDRHQAITLAKAGKEIEMKDCPNPVRDHLQLGQRMGVNGTPALVLESGEMLPGYIPAQKLAAYLDSEQYKQGK